MPALIRRTSRLAYVIPFAALLFAACNDSSTKRADGSSPPADVSSARNESPTPPVVPSLGSARTYGVLAASAVTCAGPVGTIRADVGLSPGSGITGFPTCTISGARHIANAAAATAQDDLTAAYNALAGLPCGITISADLGGRTIAPGVYCSGSSVGVTGNLTLDGQGSSDATFVIQAGSALTVAGSINLIGGARPENVHWVAGSSATLGTGSAMQGNILAFSSITLNDNASVVGRVLARNGAVVLGSNNSITLP